MIDWAAIAATIAGATFWAKGADMENRSPFLWVGVSLGVSAAVILAFGKSWVAVLLAQAAMFAAITAYRTVRDRPPGED